MLKELIVARVGGGVLPLDLDALPAAAAGEWGADVVRARRSSLSRIAVSVDVEPPDETSFVIDIATDGESVLADGTAGQNARVAAWLRSLMPVDAPRVIAFDQGWTTHVELTPAMTPDDVLAGEVSHSVPGWNANDPDLR